MKKHKVWIKRVDNIRQRYLKNQSAFTQATKKNPTDLIAAQRFGAENIKKLEKIGEGRDRKVYALDDDKVLKIAKNPAGLAQNEQESDLRYIDNLEFEEQGKDYVVTERVPRNDSKIKKFLAPLKDLSQIDAEKHSSEYQDALEKINKSDLDNYNVAMNDLKRPSSWGIKNGEPVLIDAGALSIQATNKDAHEFDKKEWQEVLQLRRQHK